MRALLHTHCKMLAAGVGLTGFAAIAVAQPTTFEESLGQLEGVVQQLNDYQQQIQQQSEEADKQVASWRDSMTEFKVEVEDMRAELEDLKKQPGDNIRAIESKTQRLEEMKSARLFVGFVRKTFEAQQVFVKANTVTLNVLNAQLNEVIDYLKISLPR
ncbi:hypothetical protein [Pseudomonas putida]